MSSLTAPTAHSPSHSHTTTAQLHRQSDDRHGLGGDKHGARAVRGSAQLRPARSPGQALCEARVASRLATAATAHAPPAPPSVTPGRAGAAGSEAAAAFLTFLPSPASA